MAEPLDRSIAKLSQNSSHPTGEGIIIDIGTGDGRFVYQCAKENPTKFFIGIDANPRPLEKISEKIHRKPAKGGLPNVLFLQAAVEDLPEELDGVADEVHIHFPWGSLLQAVVRGEPAILANLNRICAPGALLEVIAGVDWERDAKELERLGITELSVGFVRAVLAPRYQDAGFAIREVGEGSPKDWTRLHSSWAKRLADNAERSFLYFIAEKSELV